MKAIVFGATKGIGRAVARRLSERGHSVFLLGRNRADLAASATDIEIRAGREKVGFALCDLEKPATFEKALASGDAALGNFDAVFVSAAMFATQDKLENDPVFLERMLHANFTATVLFCEAARKRLLARGGGTLCVVSSVAGERARKPVILYGASKAGLTRYLEGLDHKFRSAGLRTVTVKPGFVRTGMTAGLPVPPFAGDPEGVSRDIVAAMESGTPVVYTPRIWGLVLFVIRHLPRFVMRKIKF